MAEYCSLDVKNCQIDTSMTQGSVSIPRCTRVAIQNYHILILLRFILILSNNSILAIMLRPFGFLVSRIWRATHTLYSCRMFSRLGESLQYISNILELVSTPPIEYQHIFISSISHKPWTLRCT
jgi:hypothetical protein